MKRRYLSLIKEYLSYFPCVALIGPRQSGKTSLLKQLGDAWHYLDLENTADFNAISRDPDLFFRLNKNKMAIDEAQQLPSLFPALRVAIDGQRDVTGNYVITGSSSPLLTKSISESLAGRVGIIEITPLSLSEIFKPQQEGLVSAIVDKKHPTDFLSILKQRCSENQLHDYFWRGGYPEPWIKNSERFNSLWMENYLKTYFNRDLIQLFPGLDHNKFRQFISILSGLSGTIINYSDVARALGVSQPTVRDYFLIAHQTMIWRNIPAYTGNGLKRLIKHPKGFLTDSGLSHHIQRIPDLKALLDHPSLGRMWESMIIEEILRNLQQVGAPHSYSYYRTGAGAEIDLIIEGDFGTIPIEIKYNSTIKNKDLKTITDFVSQYQCPYGIVINNDNKARMYSENVVGVPASWI